MIDRIQLKKYIHDCLNKFVLIKDIPVILTLSKQLKKHLASASCRNGIGYITVSVKRFKNIKLGQQKEIIFHEVCHVVDWYLADCFPNSWKSDRKHGRTWKGLMKQIGLKPKIRYNTNKKAKND